MKDISTARILIIATDGFEQSELMVPLQRLRGMGAQVDLASPGGEMIQGWQEKNWGETIAPDLSISDADIEDYDALIIPGGQMNPDKLRMDEEAVDIVRSAHALDLPVAAICHGPWMLVEAEVVEGARVTSWPSLRTDLENAGALWSDEPVVIDENLITSRNPGDLDAFVDAIVDLIEEDSEIDEDDDTGMDKNEEEMNDEKEADLLR